MLEIYSNHEIITKRNNYIHFDINDINEKNNSYKELYFLIFSLLHKKNKYIEKYLLYDNLISNYINDEIYNKYRTTYFQLPEIEDFINELINIYNFLTNLNTNNAYSKYIIDNTNIIIKYKNILLKEFINKYSKIFVLENTSEAKEIDKPPNEQQIYERVKINNLSYIKDNNLVINTILLKNNLTLEFHICYFLNNKCYMINSKENKIIEYSYQIVDNIIKFDDMIKDDMINNTFVYYTFYSQL